MTTGDRSQCDTIIISGLFLEVIRDTVLRRGAATVANSGSVRTHAMSDPWDSFVLATLCSSDLVSRRVLLGFDSNHRITFSAMIIKIIIIKIRPNAPKKKEQSYLLVNQVVTTLPSWI